MFGWKGALTAEQTAQIAAAKQVIYDGFKQAVAQGVPKAKGGILVDEQFGAAILRDAAQNGFTFACPAEKSGQEEFDFEYGDDFAEHIEAFHPTFSKVRVRYNPEGDEELNRRQAERLKRLSDYLQAAKRSLFMFELLVPAATVPGFIGFAVGRTAFWDPLVGWRDKKISRATAVEQIAHEYRRFVEIFEQAAGGAA